MSLTFAVIPIVFIVLSPHAIVVPHRHPPSPASAPASSSWVSPEGQRRQPRLFGGVGWGAANREEQLCNVAYIANRSDATFYSVDLWRTRIDPCTVHKLKPQLQDRCRRISSKLIFPSCAILPLRVRRGVLIFFLGKPPLSRSSPPSPCLPLPPPSPQRPPQSITPTTNTPLSPRSPSMRFTQNLTALRAGWTRCLPVRRKPDVFRPRQCRDRGSMTLMTTAMHEMSTSPPHQPHPHNSHHHQAHSYNPSSCLHPPPAPILHPPPSHCRRRVLLPRPPPPASPPNNNKIRYTMETMTTNTTHQHHQQLHQLHRHHYYPTPRVFYPRPPPPPLRIPTRFCGHNYHSPQVWVPKEEEKKKNLDVFGPTDLFGPTSVDIISPNTSGRDTFTKYSGVYYTRTYIYIYISTLF